MAARTDPERWGILCAKDHEAEHIVKVMLQKLNPTSTTKREPNLTVLTFTALRQVELIICSMGDWKQGPGPVASRAAAFIVRENLDAIGMVGVCGGLNLGDVHICATCVDNNGGYVRELEDGRADADKLRVEYKTQAPETTHTFVSDPAQKKAAPFFGKETPNFRLFSSATGNEGGLYCKPVRRWIANKTSHHERGKYPFRLSRFLCYNQVREDTYFIIDHEGCGVVEEMACIAIEMEAFGLVEAVAVCKEWFPDRNIDLFPIIKATSDTGFFDDKSPSKPKNEAVLEEAAKGYKEREGIPAVGQKLSAKEKRKAYRGIAGKKAAECMSDFLVRAISNPAAAQGSGPSAPGRGGAPSSHSPGGGPGQYYQQTANHSTFAGGMNQHCN